MIGAAPQPRGPVVSGTDAEVEYDPRKAMVAALQAMGRVRDGRWIRGAPTHVLAEFLTELQDAGWELYRVRSKAAGPGAVRPISKAVQQSVRDVTGEGER